TLHDTLAHWLLAEKAPPFSSENRSLGGGRALLIQRCPGGTTNRDSNLLQNIEGEFLWPKRFTSATKTLVGFSNRGQAKNLPVCGMLAQQPPRQIVLVPAGLNQHYGPAWLQAGVGHRGKPFVKATSNCFALRLLTIFQFVLQC